MMNQPTPEQWGPKPENLTRVVSEKSLQQHEVELKKLQELSTLDPLTGLLNRRAWDEEIEKLVSDHTRHKQDAQKKYALLALDIDFFKKINDTYGHDGGDVVLVESSKLLKHIFRSTDIIARFGGEEFFVLIKDTDIEKVIERLSFGREKASPGINFSTLLPDTTGTNKQVEISFSGGLVPVTPSSKEAVDEAIKKADILLYEAKTSGRNQVMFKESEQSTLIA